MFQFNDICRNTLFMKIVLVGYMGSGKSAIGKLLAEKLYISYIDLDAYIVSKEGTSIANIFEDKGEIYFRKQEHQYLKEVLADDRPMVIATGGGTPCYAGNMQLILEHPRTTSIYLRTSIPTLVSRVLKAQQKRPIIAQIGEEALPEFIAKHLFERRNFYEQADITIDTNDKSVKVITDEIRFALH